MKKVSIYICLFICLSAFKGEQICLQYFPSKIGTQYEMTNYSEKGKMYSVVQGTLLESNLEGAALIMKIGTKMVDDKGKEMIDGSYIVKCENDKLFMDMSNMLPAEMLKGFDGMEIEITNGFMELPTSPVAGQKMEDAQMSMSVSTNGTTLMNMQIQITERLIEGFETITTSAGTFECVKYSETITSKTIMTIKSKSTTWIAKNVGVVKTENYNDKGKLQGYSLLTAFKE